MARAAAKKIRIERENDVSFLRAINGVDVAAKGEDRALSSTVTRGWFPLMPFRLRIERENRLQLRSQRRRIDDSRENAEALAARGAKRCGLRLRGVQKLRPSLNLSGLRDRLCAIGIVKIQDGSLREHVGRAEARRMVGIPFDFRQPSFIALDQQADRVRPKRHRHSIKLWLAEDHSIRLLDVRNDVLLGGLPASRKPGKRERRSHELQKVASVDR